MTHLSNWGASVGSRIGTKSDVSTSRNGASIAIMSGARTTTAQEPAFFASGEAVTIPPTSMVSASPRSAPFPAYCISLVSATQQASEPEPREASPRGCRQLPVNEPACLPSHTRYGYTGSVTPAPFVRPDCSSPRPATGTGQLGADSAAPVGAPTNTAAVPVTTAMCGSGGGPLPDASSIRSLLNAVAPRLAIDRIHIIPVPTAHRLQRVYELRVSSLGDYYYGTHNMFVLVLAPPSMLRLLRSEQCIVKSEAVVVKWIRSVLLSGGFLQVAERSAKPDLDHRDMCTSNFGTMDQYRGHVGDETLFKDVDLLKLLPALIDHSQFAEELGSAYNILSHLNGLSLSLLPKGLTISERKHIDFQAGRLVRRLSLLRSPSGQFGPAISVLCPTAATQGRAGGSMEKPGGMDRWSLAFHAILEGVLRDAEDMAVTIAYQTIRRHFRRLGCYLDGVTVPRLVILDAAHDSNVMAERIDPALEQKRKARMRSKDPLENSDGGGDDDDDDYDYDYDDDDEARQSKDLTIGIRVTGLRDWSNCIFGDPLMAMVFSEEPSREFLRGFSGLERRPKEHNHNDDDHGVFANYGDIVDYPEEAQIRLLLYQCYHATVAVVKEFYRPHSDCTNREFAARKRLNAVLAKLEDVDDDHKRSHVRPSCEMSPAKKPKTDGEDDQERQELAA